MRQGLCNGTLSVCLSQLLIAAVARGRFAAVGPAGWRYRAIAARSTPQQHSAQQHHDIQWLLRLVTGGPLVVGAPDSSVYFKSEGSGPNLRK